MSHSTETHVRLLGQRWAEAEQRGNTAIAIGRQTQQAEYQGTPPTVSSAPRTSPCATPGVGLRAVPGDGNGRSWPLPKRTSSPLPADPLASRTDIAAMTQDLNEQAGDRADEIELAMNLVAVGDEVPTWIKRFTGADANSSESPTSP